MPTCQRVWTSMSALLYPMFVVLVLCASILKVSTTVSAQRDSVLSKKKSTCTDEDECESGRHNCSQDMNKECKNTPRSFACVCTKGYQLSTDSGSPTCERINATSRSNDSDRVDPAVIAGIVVAILLVVGLSCFLLVFLLR